MRTNRFLKRGLSIHLEAAMTKIWLVPNGPHAAFYCGTCDQGFDLPVE